MNGSDSINPWGFTDSATYGQTVTTPTGQTRLNSFTFYVRDNAAAISYQAYVYQWNTAAGRIVGPALYASSVLTTPGANTGNFLANQFNTGGINLTAGNKYALFLTTSGVGQGPASGTTVWGLAGGFGANPYAGGSFIYYNNSANFGALSATQWDCPDPCGLGDLAFQAMFGNAANFVALATTKNQLAVANVLQAAADANATGNGGALIAALGNVSAADTPAALDALSGEGVTGAQQMAFGASNQFISTVMGQGASWRDGRALPGTSAATSPAGPSYLGGKERSALPLDETAERNSPWRLWAAGFGATASLDGRLTGTGSADLSTHTGGIAAGIDFQHDRTLLAGIAIGASSSGFTVDQRATSGDADGLHVGLYAVKRFGPLYLSGTASYANFDVDTKRYIFGIGATERALGRFSSTELDAKLEAGWKLAYGTLNVTPFASLQVSQLKSGAFGEQSTTLGGAPGILGLAYSAKTVHSLPILLGAQIDTLVPLAGGATLAPFARFAWVHEFKPDRSIDASLISVPGALFTVDGARVASDALKVNAGLNLELARGIGVYGAFDGEFSGRSESYAGTGGLKIAW